MANDPEQPATDPETARVFVEHVLASAPSSIEELCAAHPERADELRALHARWSDAVLGSSLIERLRKRHGRDLKLDIALGEAPGEEQREGGRPSSSRAAGPSSSVYGRLQDRGDGAGRYRHEGEIARGGMGAILEVWDADLRRTLAMKVALTGSAGSADGETSARDSRLLERFLEEAQITGQLDHPGIVPVHELGLDAEGRVYFTMRLVKGRDLEQIFELVHAGREGWTLTRALGVMQKICEAMAFAHEKGVIHRDLKPANVMVGRFGVTYVMDWGLARVLGREDAHDVRLADASQALSIVRTDRADARSPESPLVTMDGDIVGTPCYMAPEQARGRVQDIGPHSDVYAAGSMLYHLLSGSMPYVPKGEQVSPGAVLAQLLAGPPRKIAELDPSVPEELISICDMAMAREPSERYPTMLALAEDLRAFLEDRVVRAHATGPVAEIRKWVRRNRTAALAGAAAVVLALAGLATVVLVQARANEDLQLANEAAGRARDEAQTARDEALAAQAALEESNAELAAARDEADEKTRLARLNEYAASIAAAGASLELANTADVRRRLADCEPDLRGWEWHHLELAADASVRDLLGQDQDVSAMALHPDGRRVALRTEDDVVKVIDLASGELLRSIEVEPGNANVLAFEADGEGLVTVDEGHTLQAWNLATGRKSRTFAVHDQLVTCLAVDPHTGLYATGSYDKIVRIWDAESGKFVRALEGHGSSIRCLDFGPRGERLASGARDKTVRVWDLATGETTLVLDGPEYQVAFVDFDPLGTRLAAGFTALDTNLSQTRSRGANTVRVWDLPGGELVSVLAGPDGPLTSGGFNPDGTRVFASSVDTTLWSWDLVGGRDQVLLGHRTGVVAAAYRPEGESIVTASSSDRVKLWRPDVQLGFLLEGHSSKFTGLAFAKGGAALLTASQDATVRLWDTDSGLVRGVLRGHSGLVRDVAVDASGERAATASVDGTVRVWELGAAREVARLGETRPLFGTASFSEAPRSVDLFAGGELVLVGGPENRVRVWRWGSDEPPLELEGPAEGQLAQFVRVSPNEDYLVAATGTLDGKESSVFVWDSAGGELLARREGIESQVRALDVSPDGSRIAAAFGRRVQLLDPIDLQSGLALQGHAKSVNALHFSQDGRRLASGAVDESVILWDLESGASLLGLQSPGSQVVAVEFSPSGTQLAVAYEDQRAFLWDTAPTAERVQARERALAERRAVLPLLDELFASFPSSAAVVERLRSDPSLETSRLRTAVSLARLVGDDLRSNDRESWRALRRPGAIEVDLHVALWAASIAVQAEEGERALRLLGSTLYRLGRLESAVETLERANEARRSRSRVEVMAFLAMAYHRLGDVQSAASALADLRLLMQIPVNLGSRESQMLLRETEVVLRGPAGAG